VRTLIVHMRRRRFSRSVLALACVAALMVAAVPAAAAPQGGRFDPRFSPSLQQQPQVPVIRELHTVIRERDANQTLAIVLAGIALLVASGTGAYSVAVGRRGPSTQT